MNEQEQKTAQALLENITKSDPNSAVALANAYLALTQGALNRVNAERASK